MRSYEFRGDVGLRTNTAVVVKFLTRGICALVTCLLLARVSDSEQLPTIVVDWNNTVLAAVRRARIGPPMAARALAIVHTCMYDAWAAYDSRALGTQFGSKLRRPRSDRTDANKRIAISYAAHRAAVDLFPLLSG
jgi:hypothetical protein